MSTILAVCTQCTWRRRRGSSVYDARSALAVARAHCRDTRHPVAVIDGERAFFYWPFDRQVRLEKYGRWDAP